MSRSRLGGLAACTLVGIALGMQPGWLCNPTAFAQVRPDQTGLTQAASPQANPRKTDWPNLKTEPFSTPGTGNPTAQWQLASRLFARGEYYRSVTENLRFVYFYPNHPRAQAARLRVVEAHLLGREPKRALYWLAYWRQQPTVFKSLAAPAKPIQKNGGDPRKKPNITPQQPPQQPPQQTNLQAAQQANWLWLEALAHLELATQKHYLVAPEALQQSLDLLTQIPENTHKKAAAQHFVEAWQGSHFAPDEKSALLAGGLSALVPGSGAFYLHQPGEGLLTLLVVGMLAVGSAEAQRKDASGLSLGLGLGAFAFYGGGIYSALNGARRHNDRLRVKRLAALRRKHFLHLRPSGWTVFETRF